MNPNDLKRGIVSRHSRADGGSHGLEKLERIPRRSVIPGSGGHRRRSGKARQQQGKIWSIILGGVALCVLLLTFIIWLLPVLQRGKSGEVTMELPAARREASVHVASRFPSPSGEEALKLVENALSNRDPGQVEHLFRKGNSSPQEIVSFCMATEKRDGAFNGLNWISSLDTPELLIEGVVAKYKDVDTGEHQRLVLLTPDRDGRWQVDFDAFARAVKPSWEQILRLDNPQGTIRVIVTPDVYYNGPFRNESEWTSYTMTSPDVEIPLHGYGKRNSPQDRVLRRMFSEGGKSMRVTLEIRRVEGGGERQFEISRVLAQDWIIPAAALPDQARRGF